MKYCVLIIDGAAGWPLPSRGGVTCLELAHTPNLDAMAREGVVGLARTVPADMEPSSACACMSVLGYDPKLYYTGRSTIEAKGLGIPIEDGEVVFRCNLVAVRDGRMWSYSAGHISTSEAQSLITSLNKGIGNDEIQFYSGVSYRNICKIKGHEDMLLATCTPPHDIADKLVGEFLPRGAGSHLLRGLMSRSELILSKHPVNMDRISRGVIPATMIWLFWGAGRIADLPPFKEAYRLSAALTSGVDIMRGLAKMMGMEELNIPGVTDGLDSDCAAQATEALAALARHDLVVIHVEAPDEAGHAGSIDGKIEAIQKVDSDILDKIRSYQGDELRVLVMPDHPTPIEIQTHTGDPVPFMLWGPGFATNGATRVTEAKAKSTGAFIEEGYHIMKSLVA